MEVGPPSIYAYRAPFWPKSKRMGIPWLFGAITRESSRSTVG